MPKKAKHKEEPEIEVGPSPVALAVETDDSEVDLIEQLQKQHEDLAWYNTPPIPFDENAVPVSKRNWVDDYGDHVIPSGKGFISDFVYHTRGYMIPTLACIWSSLFLLSSAIKREAWIKWMPNALFANFFMIIIGPAGRAKKTTAITLIGYPMLRDFRNHLKDPNLKEMKHIHITKDMGTPEFVIDSMLPENKQGKEFFYLGPDGEYIKGPDGRCLQYKKTSETTLISSELSTFLSSKSYSDSMSATMLDLYDCHDTWEWGTLSRGKRTLRRMYTTFCAGTTVDGLRESIPRAAKGDGFLSRTIMCYVPASKRKYPTPRNAVGSPTQLDMTKRLAWVAEHTIGEFELSPEAFTEYEKWYDWFYSKMEDNPALEGAISRMDVNLLKTAFLIRASRYEKTDPVIELEDLLDAIRLIDATYASLPFLLSQLDPDEITVAISKVEMFLRPRKKALRPRLMATAKLRQDGIYVVLEELAARGCVQFEVDGKMLLHTTGRSDEIVHWTGVSNDGEGEAESPGQRPDFSYTQEVRGHKSSGPRARDKSRRFAKMDDAGTNPDDDLDGARAV